MRSAPRFQERMTPSSVMPMMASSDHSTIAASSAPAAATPSSAVSTSRAATSTPTPITIMSAMITPPSSQGAASPPTKAVTLRPRSPTSAAAPAPTTAGCLSARPLTRIKPSAGPRSIVRSMNYPASELVIDPVLIRTYDVSGPRYTSYPTADRFVEAYGEPDLRQWLGKRNIGGISQPLSVYVHLPFCDTLCYYCGCNKVITRDHSRSAKYIKYLQAELALLAPLLEADRRIVQLHWGGGTPTFLTREEMGELWRVLKERFEFSPDCESSIEVD